MRLAWEAAAEWQNEGSGKQQTKPWFFQMEKTQELLYTLSDDGKLVISGTGSLLQMMHLLATLK